MTQTQPLTDVATPFSVANDCAALRSEIATRLAITNKNARRYRIQSLVLLVIGLMFGVIATTLAGSAALDERKPGIAAGAAQQMTGTAPSPLPRGWRVVCGLIAVCSFLGTAANGMNNVLEITQHRSKAFVCMGVLDALHMELLLDSSIDATTVARVKSSLAKLLQDNPEYVR